MEESEKLLLVPKYPCIDANFAVITIIGESMQVNPDDDFQSYLQKYKGYSNN